MKRILALFCLALTVAPVGAQADTLHTLVQGLDTAVVIKIGGDQDRRRGRDRDDDRGSNWRDNRDDDRDRDRPRSENRDDGRINRARAVASSRGRVLDAGQQGGSIFWVRVATPDGRRVDLLVDGDSGRIVGER